MGLHDVVVGTTYDLRYVLSFEPSSRQKSIANLRKLKNSEARSEHEVPEVEVDTLRYNKMGWWRWWWVLG